MKRWVVPLGFVLLTAVLTFALSASASHRAAQAPGPAAPASGPFKKPPGHHVIPHPVVIPRPSGRVLGPVYYPSATCWSFWVDGHWHHATWIPGHWQRVCQ